jgi:flagellar biosynthesis anti-sigma factor FlgM
MRIETQPVTPVSNDPKSDPPAAQAASPAGRAASPSAVVKLSPGGTSAAASAELKETHDLKVQARILEIREQLRNGSYPVDLDELARRIVDDELSRGGGE